MQLRHLEYFVATADAGTVTAAAAAVHVTQPALSRQLRQLEDDLGVQLFDRVTGRLHLNRTGRALLPAAREVLRSAADLADIARLHERGKVERLAICAPTVTLTDVVSPFVATMSAEDPVIEVRGGDGLAVEEMLEAGADVAIGTQRPGRPYAAQPLAELPVWAYVRPEDELASQNSARLETLVDRPLVVLPKTFTAREALDNAVHHAGVSLSSVVVAANGTIAQALAASGRGIAVVSDDPRYDLVAVPIDLGHEVLHVRLTAAWDPRSVAVPAVELLVERLREWVAHRYPSQVSGPGSDLLRSDAR